MNFRVRPAGAEDFQEIYKMAKLTGGGFTNLPPDRATLVKKLVRSAESFAREEDEQRGDLYMFVLEDPESGAIRGTCQVFGQVGVTQPFYSYHLSTLTQSSPELSKRAPSSMPRPCTTNEAFMSQFNGEQTSRPSKMPQFRAPRSLM